MNGNKLANHGYLLKSPNSPIDHFKVYRSLEERNPVLEILVNILKESVDKMTVLNTNILHADTPLAL